MAYGFNDDKSKFQLDGILNSFVTEKSVEQKLSSNIESTSTATRTYAVGDYAIVAGVLKKVTATIASGSTFNSSNSKNITVLDEMKGSSNLNFTTAEKDTGLTWINGEPIYAITKVWLTQALNNSMRITHGIANIETIVDYLAVYCDGDSYIRFPITGSTTDKTVGLRISPTTIAITGTDSYSAKPGRNLYITIYYTKK